MTQRNPAPSLSSPRTAPSIHVRAALTWLAILVAIGLTATAPFTVGWDPVLRAFVLTLVVVPLAVSLVVPRLKSIYDRYIWPRRQASEVCSRSGLTTGRGPQNGKDPTRCR